MPQSLAVHSLQAPEIVVLDMAPELFPPNVPYGTKVDLYSFALCLFDMVLGLNPWRGLNGMHAGWSGLNGLT